MPPSITNVVPVVHDDSSGGEVDTRVDHALRSAETPQRDALEALVISLLLS